ncbi:ATP-dependent helicase Upf1 [Hamiltosporidium tvaerminnensis]|uniref:ATP-dependent helicase Upf1 n=2 Tax=Hamiltosporidium tvaerminnensis TaxID=1176355 RepID=A0A4Q9L6T1_9MICR|nr:ATP-dependent helicase Upf1 [Hamiltosporidium tvaerminnensis]
MATNKSLLNNKTTDAINEFLKNFDTTHLWCSSRDRSIKIIRNLVLYPNICYKTEIQKKIFYSLESCNECLKNYYSIRNEIVTQKEEMILLNGEEKRIEANITIKNNFFIVSEIYRYNWKMLKNKKILAWFQGAIANFFIRGSKEFKTLKFPFILIFLSENKILLDCAINNLLSVYLESSCYLCTDLEQWNYLLEFRNSSYILVDNETPLKSINEKSWLMALFVYVGIEGTFINEDIVKPLISIYKETDAKEIRILIFKIVYICIRRNPSWLPHFVFILSTIDCYKYFLTKVNITLIYDHYIFWAPINFFINSYDLYCKIYLENKYFEFLAELTNDINKREVFKVILGNFKFTQNYLKFLTNFPFYEELIMILLRSKDPRFESLLNIEPKFIDFMVTKTFFYIFKLPKINLEMQENLSVIVQKWKNIFIFSEKILLELHEEKTLEECDKPAVENESKVSFTTAYKYLEFSKLNGFYNIFFFDIESYMRKNNFPVSLIETYCKLRDLFKLIFIKMQKGDIKTMTNEQIVYHSVFKCNTLTSKQKNKFKIKISEITPMLLSDILEKIFIFNQRYNEFPIYTLQILSFVRQCSYFNVDILKKIFAMIKTGFSYWQILYLLEYITVQMRFKPEDDLAYLCNFEWLECLTKAKFKKYNIRVFVILENILSVLSNLNISVYNVNLSKICKCYVFFKLIPNSSVIKYVEKISKNLNCDNPLINLKEFELQDCQKDDEMNSPKRVDISGSECEIIVEKKKPIKVKKNFDKIFEEPSEDGISIIEKNESIEEKLDTDKISKEPSENGILIPESKETLKEKENNDKISKEPSDEDRSTFETEMEIPRSEMKISNLPLFSESSFAEKNSNNEEKIDDENKKSEKKMINQENESFKNFKSLVSDENQNYCIKNNKEVGDGNKILEVNSAQIFFNMKKEAIGNRSKTNVFFTSFGTQNIAHEANETIILDSKELINGIKKPVELMNEDITDNIIEPDTSADAVCTEIQELPELELPHSPKRLKSKIDYNFETTESLNTDVNQDINKTSLPMSSIEFENQPLNNDIDIKEQILEVRSTDSIENENIQGNNILEQKPEEKNYLLEIEEINDLTELSSISDEFRIVKIKQNGITKEVFQNVNPSKNLQNFTEEKKVTHRTTIVTPESSAFSLYEKSMKTSNLIQVNTGVSNSINKDGYTFDASFFIKRVLSFESITSGSLYKNFYIPATFNSYKEYFNIFKPFIFEEAKALIEKGIEESSTEKKIFILEELAHINENADLFLISEINPNFQEFDFVSIEPEKNHLNEIPISYFYGVVLSIKPVKSSFYVQVRIFGLNTKFLKKKISLTLKYICGLSTVFREYNSLFYFKNSSLSDFILAPNLIPLRNLKVKYTAAEVARNFELNYSQAQSLLACFNSTSPFTLIQGPPGTGKTKTIVAIVAAFLNSDFYIKKFTKPRILVCAPSNVAVDELTRRIHKEVPRLSKKNDILILRSGVMVQQAEDMIPFTLDFLIEKADINFSNSTDISVNFMDKKKKRNYILQNCDIICTTLSSSCSDLMVSNSLDFDVVIIDEACQAVETSTLIPFKYSPDKVVLVGDYKQLPPTIISNLLPFEKTLFDRLSKYLPVNLLRMQYRMNPLISKFANSYFYDNNIKNHPSVISRKDLYSKFCKPINFINSFGTEIFDKAFSFLNENEAESVVRLISKFLFVFSGENLNGRIGVITFYKSQSKLIKKKLLKLGKPEILKIVEVNTVDAFQGQEKDVIIVSCVRTRGLGFISDQRRINVALTRAKHALFIFGESKCLEKSPCWKAVVSFYKKSSRFYINCKSFFKTGIICKKN